MFDQKQIGEFKEAFSLIDHDQDGFIDREDLKDILASLGQTPTDAEVDEMLQDATGPINFTMFLTLFGEKMSGTDPAHEILSAFEWFDTNESANGPKTGLADAEFLREWMTTMGDKFTEDEVDVMFKGIPLDSNGHFNYRDFVRVLKNAE